jgi:hypothetical protein
MFLQNTGTHSPTRLQGTCLLICNLFNNAISNTDYMALHEWMISEG